jgi:hypothetical protein
LCVCCVVLLLACARVRVWAAPSVADLVCLLACLWWLCCSPIFGVTHEHNSDTYEWKWASKCAHSVPSTQRIILIEPQGNQAPHKAHCHLNNVLPPPQKMHNMGSALITQETVQSANSKIANADMGKALLQSIYTARKERHRPTPKQPLS